MDKLIAGYRRFRQSRWLEQKALYEALAAGQRPRMLIIACADSRVDPATIFDVAPGEIFIVRNVANLVPPCAQDEGLHGTSAAIEFAVQELGVRTILVLGHARCGGIAAALNPQAGCRTGFVASWIKLLDAPLARVQSLSCEPVVAQETLEREAIRESLRRLETFPFVAQWRAAGALELVGARFDILTGHLEVLDHFNSAFEPVQ